jgi:outer membrane protein OmpA-like peptidoglycan-associated protein
LTPAPAVSFGADAPPARPKIAIPDAPHLSPFVIPPAAPMTPPDRADRSAAPIFDPSERPPMVSPGASESAIDAVAFVIDPGSSQIGGSGEAKLREVAQAMKANPAARLEVRTFSSNRSQSESNARRLSLARFIAIRDALIRAGVDDNRIDGRALISRPDELNADRVELYVER